MKEPTLQEDVARLDGLVAGLAALCGKPRDYSAYCYCLEFEDSEPSVETYLANYYKPHSTLALSSTASLERGIQDFEIEIRDFLLRDVPSLSANMVVDMKKLLSFRVMDVISRITSEASINEILKLTGRLAPSKTECVFFCIVMERLALVLQFNDDREFKKQILSARTHSDTPTKGSD